VSDAKKLFLFWGVSFAVGFYCVYVMQQLWNWFAVPLLHVGEASYLQMYGLNALFALITARDTPENPVGEARWQRVFTILNACVPSAGREMLTEEIQIEDAGLWLNLGTWVFGIAFGYTASLGIGFLVHMFA
jgi:hypothetical protein